MILFLKRLTKNFLFKLSPSLFKTLNLSSDFYLFFDQYLDSRDYAYTIFEIGSHFGVDTFKLSNIFPNAHIYAFEPDLRNYEVLRHLEGNPNIQINNLALSDTEGTAEFYMSISSKKNFSKFKDFSWIDESFFTSNALSRSGASSLLKGHESLINAKKIMVSTLTLDHFCNNNSIESIDLLWIDVQGAEKLVLGGADHILKNVNYIWIEYGFVEYEGGLDRRSTIIALSKTHKICEKFSDTTKTGNLFFINHQIQ